jgi:hypothetical protein
MVATSKNSAATHNKILLWSLIEALLVEAEPCGKRVYPVLAPGARSGVRSAAMTTDLHAIPREVWRGFVDGGGLERVEPLRHFRALTTVRLDPATAQTEVDTQRQRFMRLIVELFPLDRVEAFIAAHLEAGVYPRLQTIHFDGGLMQPLASAIAREAEPVPAPFDLETDRSGRYGKARLDASEYGYAAELLRLRPALALSTMFLRGFLEMWGHALAEASRGSLNAEQAPSYGFFLTSWNQGSMITVLYPSIALHLRPRIDLGGTRIDEPAFTRPLMSDVMAWLTVKGFFVRQAAAQWHGYDAKLSCAATGMLNQAVGKRGWLNAIFDKVVEHRHIPGMQTYLEQVVLRGNRLLAATAERAASFGQLG